MFGTSEKKYFCVRACTADIEIRPKLINARVLLHSYGSGLSTFTKQRNCHVERLGIRVSLSKRQQQFSFLNQLVCDASTLYLGIMIN